MPSQIVLDTCLKLISPQIFTTLGGKTKNIEAAKNTYVAALSVVFTGSIEMGLIVTIKHTYYAPLDQA